MSRVTALREPRCSLHRFIRPPHHVPTCAPARAELTQIYCILTLHQTLRKTKELQSQALACAAFSLKRGNLRTGQRHLTKCETVQLRPEPLEEFTLEAKTVS